MATLTFGTGAGTGATGSVTSDDDSSGFITITTGTSPILGAVIASLVFGQPYAFAPEIVFLSPANANAATANANVFVPSTSLATVGFDLTNNAVALLAATTYDWYYTAGCHG